MNTKRAIHALAVMNDRLYAIGGNHLKGKILLKHTAQDKKMSQEMLQENNQGLGSLIKNCLPIPPLSQSVFIPPTPQKFFMDQKNNTNIVIIICL